MSLTPIRIAVLLFIALTLATPHLHAKQEKKLPSSKSDDKEVFSPETKSCVDINVLKTCKKGKCTYSKCAKDQYCLEPKQVYGTDAKASPIKVAACYTGTATDLGCVGDHHLLQGVGISGETVKIKKPCPEDKPYCVDKVEKKNLCQENPLTCVDDDKTDYEKIIKLWSSSQKKTGTIGDASVLKPGKITNKPGGKGTTLAKDLCKTEGGPYLQERACDKNGKLQTLTIDCRSLSPKNTPVTEQALCQKTANDGPARCAGTVKDTDGDWVKDPFDNCPTISNPKQQDKDEDGVGNACDNCQSKPNSTQADVDNDAVGDECDNCLVIFNQDQADKNGDGSGDVCDSCPVNVYSKEELILIKSKGTDENNNLIVDACEFPQLISICSLDVNDAKLCYASISADGRFVANHSEATNLVDGDTNNVNDIFVHDRESKQTTRVSLNSTGKEGNDASSLPSISADGRFVAFQSHATNFVDGDTKDILDIFVHDRNTKQTTHASLSSVGKEGNDASSLPSISADGRFVAFYSYAANLVDGDTNGVIDIFVHDRETKQTQRVSLNSAGNEGNNFSWLPSISTDGRFVAFYSYATNLVDGDTNNVEDIFVHDRETKQTTRVSLNPSGEAGNYFSLGPSCISTDGRFVAFESYATNLVDGDTNDNKDIFVHDRETQQTTRVSLNSAGEEGNHGSRDPSISADGRFVAFSSGATNLVDVDANGKEDIFVHDRETKLTTRVSLNSAGQEGNKYSREPSISADGRFIVFSSISTNLMDGYNNSAQNIFLTINPLWTPPEEF